MQKIKSTLGPAGPGGYVQATGVPMAFGEFETILSAQCKCYNDNIVAVNDINYAIRTVIVGTIVQAHIWFQNTTGGAWTELAGATALNARTFTFLVDGE